MSWLAALVARLGRKRPRRGSRRRHAAWLKAQPKCRRCSILESKEEPLIDGLCITCWWREDGGKTYEFVEGKDPERWERLRVALEKVLDEKDVIEYTYK